MIKNILKIYPGETVYSYLSRSLCRSGFVSHMGFVREIFKRPSEYVNYNYINVLKDQYKNELEKYISFKDLLLNHTLFKYYVRFLNKEKRLKAFKLAMNSDVNLYKFLTITYNKKEKYLRYCPMCVKDDREKFGECYFHVEHMFSEIGVCYKHCCRLVDTKLENKKKDTIFVPLELLVNDNDEVVIYDEEDINVKVAKYIYYVFSKDINLNEDKKIKDHLLYYLDNKYKSVRGGKRYTSLLIKDIDSCFVGLEFYQLNKSRIERIFRDLSWNPYDICLLGMFENISEYSNYKEDTIKDEFDNRLLELRNNGYSFNKISSITGINHETIRKVIYELEDIK